MTKKYELTRNSVTVDNRVLYQIRALRGFGFVKAGDLGGYIETEKNLSHDGTCWVSENAWVFGNAQVYENANISGNAQVYGNAQVSGNALVSGGAHVSGNAHVYGDAWVYRNAHVYEDAQVYGGARVSGNAHVHGNAWVYVPIDFDCDFDPYESLKEILDQKEILPTLLGINSGLDKMISERLK